MKPSKIITSSLFSGSATYLASNIFNAAIPFALLPILTRYLSTTEYGQVTMFQVLIVGLTALIGVNTVGAANRKYYDTGQTTRELAEFIGACMQILILSSVVIFVLIFIFRNLLAQWLGLHVGWILSAILVSAATFIVNLRLGQWQVRKCAIQFGTLQVSQSFINALLSLILVIIFGLGAAGRILAQIWAIPLFACIALYFLIKNQLLIISWRPDHIREALGFGVPLIPHIAGMFLLSAVDKLVINSMLGLSQAGIYMVAVQLTMVMTIVFDAINKAYVPWLFERLKNNQSHELKQIVRWTYAYFVIAIAVALIGFAIGPYAVTLLAGAEYKSAGQLIGWLALGQAFGGMYLMVTNYIFYSKRTGLLSLATITSGLFGFGLLLLLVKPYGLEGAAWSFVIAMATRFILTWIAAQKRHPMPWFHFRSAPNQLPEH